MEPASSPTPFRVEVPPQKLAAILHRVHEYRWDALSEPPGADDWRHGPPIAWMRGLTAVAAFRDPVFPMPPRAVAEKSHHVVRYGQMPRGGHFPFYEASDLPVDDLRRFAHDLPRG